jgi:hypothetical protein
MHGAADEFGGEDYPSDGPSPFPPETDAVFRDFAGAGNASRAAQSLRHHRRERISVRREVCEEHVYSTAGRCFACGQHRD